MRNWLTKYLCIIIVLIGAVLLSTNYIKADSGWDSDYDSGGSWDSGSDWGGSSWDNDYDYDYDSGSSSGGSSCKTEECIKQRTTTMVIVLLILVGFSLIVSINSNKKTNHKVKRKENQVNKVLKVIDKEKANSIIPNFDIEEFNFKAYQIFYDIQMAWSDFDYDKLKELVTDELYNTYIMDLEALKIKNHKNTMKGFELIDSCLFDLKEENGLYVAKVCLNVKFYDYIENCETGIILRGSPNRKLNNTYILTFIRSKKEVDDANNCPTCGAPVEGNSTGICEYCKSKLINENYNWVMSEKEKISQK